MILSVVALLTAYLVIVSYQFNAGAVIYTIFHDNLGSNLSLDRQLLLQHYLLLLIQY